METWWIGPLIGGTFGLIGFLRGRDANKRLQRIEDFVVERAAAQTDTPQELAQQVFNPLHVAPGMQTVREKIGEAIVRLPEREKLIVILYMGILGIFEVVEGIFVVE